MSAMHVKSFDTINLRNANVRKAGIIGAFVVAALAVSTKLPEIKETFNEAKEKYEAVVWNIGHEASRYTQYRGY